MKIATIGNAGRKLPDAGRKDGLGKGGPVSGREMAESGAGFVAPSTVVAAVLCRNVPAGMGGGGTGWFAVRHGSILEMKRCQRKRLCAKSLIADLCDSFSANVEMKTLGLNPGVRAAIQAARMVIP
jgi:hypothetical protein